MASRQPVTQLATHEVTNQPPALENYDPYDLDRPLVEAIEMVITLHDESELCNTSTRLYGSRA